MKRAGWPTTAGGAFLGPDLADVDPIPPRAVAGNVSDSEKAPGGDTETRPEDGATSAVALADAKMVHDVVESLVPVVGREAAVDLVRRLTGFSSLPAAPLAPLTNAPGARLTYQGVPRCRCDSPWPGRFLPDHCGACGWLLPEPEVSIPIPADRGYAGMMQALRELESAILEDATHLPSMPPPDSYYYRHGTPPQPPGAFEEAMFANFMRRWHPSTATPSPPQREHREGLRPRPFLTPAPRPWGVPLDFLLVRVTLTRTLTREGVAFSAGLLWRGLRFLRRLHFRAVVALLRWIEGDADSARPTYKPTPEDEAHRALADACRGDEELEWWAMECGVPAAMFGEPAVPLPLQLQQPPPPASPPLRSVP